MPIESTQSALLVRITRITGPLEGSSITLDTGGHAQIQRELRQNMMNICEPIIQRYGVKPPDKTDAIEIITGRTANRIERMEETLNDCRNLLIDLEPDEPKDGELRDRIVALIDEIGTELGYD